MDNFVKLSVLLDKLISISKVYGPYINNVGRKFVIVTDKDGRRTVSYPKYLIEQHLGKRLDENMTVDHIVYNQNNNNLSNLRVVPRAEHSADDTRRVIFVKLKCDNCGKDFERSPRVIRDKAMKGVRGNFCSKQCSAVYSRAVQLGKKKKLPKVKPIESEYYRRKILDRIACIKDYLMKKGVEIRP